MAASHHGDDPEVIRRFIEQINGTARREYPAGRMGGDDDGALSYAVAADLQHNTVVIRFGKAVEWIGLGRAETQALIDNLQEKLMQLDTAGC
jgi:hypothetical protein